MADPGLTLDDRAARERVARVEALLAEIEAMPDPAARDRAVEVVQALLDVYGEGLARIVAHLAAHDDGTMARALADDELVAHLLMLHDLHPVPLRARVLGALDEVRPYLASHGGDVELLGVDDGIVRLRLDGSCNGCPSSTVTLKLAIEEAIHKAAPDVEAIEAEGARPAAPAPPQLLQLEISDALRKPATDGAGTWAPAGTLADLGAGGPQLRDVGGERLLFLGLDGGAYAYKPSCPECGASLADGVMRDTELCCTGCGLRYDVRQAGTCLDDPTQHLAPVPLLVDGAGTVKVALGAAA
jgi:Fe-S cluster biogenesis protein NfuA/nitrite reductase/ring-hydroxylating ferredoxin subunit